MDTVASTKLSEILKDRLIGEAVNTHVVESFKQPKPDFEAMRRTVMGGNFDGSDKGEPAGSDAKHGQKS